MLREGRGAGEELEALDGMRFQGVGIGEDELRRRCFFHLRD